MNFDDSEDEDDNFNPAPADMSDDEGAERDADEPGVKVDDEPASEDAPGPNGKNKASREDYKDDAADNDDAGDDEDEDKQEDVADEDDEEEEEEEEDDDEEEVTVRLAMQLLQTGHMLV
jgi:transcription elongation factor SPT5